MVRIVSHPALSFFVTLNSLRGAAILPEGEEHLGQIWDCAVTN